MWQLIGGILYLAVLITMGVALANNTDNQLSKNAGWVLIVIFAVLGVLYITGVMGDHRPLPLPRELR